MAAVLVQQTTASGTTAGAAPSLSGTAAGNTLVLLYAGQSTLNNANAVITGIIDTQGNAWTKRIQQRNASTPNTNAEIWSAPNIIGGAGANTLTITTTGTTVGNHVYLNEWSGLSSTTDATSHNIGTSGTTVSTDGSSVSTTNANDVIFGVVGVAATSAIATGPSGGFTPFTQPGTITVPLPMAAYNIVSATQTIIVSWTDTVGNGWAGVGWAVQQAAATVTAAGKRLITKRVAPKITKKKPSARQRPIEAIFATVPKHVVKRKSVVVHRPKLGHPFRIGDNIATVTTYPGHRLIKKPVKQKVARKKSRINFRSGIGEALLPLYVARKRIAKKLAKRPIIRPKTRIKHRSSVLLALSTARRKHLLQIVRKPRKKKWARRFPGQNIITITGAGRRNTTKQPTQHKIVQRHKLLLRHAGTSVSPANTARRLRKQPPRLSIIKRVVRWVRWRIGYLPVTPVPGLAYIIPLQLWSSENYESVLSSSEIIDMLLYSSESIPLPLSEVA